MPILPKFSHLSALGWLKQPIIFIVVLGGILLWLSLFVVEPTQMAEVRRFGEVTTREPHGPGLHLKLPLIDQVDHLQVSLDILQVQNMTMYTVDTRSRGYDGKIR